MPVDISERLSEITPILSFLRVAEEWHTKPGLRWAFSFMQMNAMAEWQIAALAPTRPAEIVREGVSRVRTGHLHQLQGSPISVGLFRFRLHHAHRSELGVLLGLIYLEARHVGGPF